MERSVRRSRKAGQVDDVPTLVGDWELEQIPGFDQARVWAALRLQLADPKMAAAWVAAADRVPIGYLLAVYVLSLEHLGLTAEIDEFYVRLPGTATAVSARPSWRPLRRPP